MLKDFYQICCDLIVGFFDTAKDAVSEVDGKDAIEKAAKTGHDL